MEVLTLCPSLSTDQRARAYIAMLHTHVGKSTLEGDKHHTLLCVCVCVCVYVCVCGVCCVCCVCACVVCVRACVCVVCVCVHAGISGNYICSIHVGNVQ